MKYRILLIFLCLSFLGNSAFADKAIWIDVRTPNEFASGHLQEALNIPHTKIEGEIASITADKEAPIHLYCRSGNRAGVAKRILNKMGYTNVVNEGGYQNLLKQKK